MFSQKLYLKISHVNFLLVNFNNYVKPLDRSDICLNLGYMVYIKPKTTCASQR